MINKYHNHKPQKTPWYREEELAQVLMSEIFQHNKMSLGKI